MLHKIKLIFEEEENRMHFELKGQYTEGEAMDFIIDFMKDQDPCKLICDYHLGLNFEDRLKLSLLSLMTSKFSSETNKTLGANFGMAIASCLEAPCAVIGVTDSIGYLPAIEEVFGKIIPRDEFDKIHEEAHKIKQIMEAMIDYLESGEVKHFTTNLN